MGVLGVGAEMAEWKVNSGYGGELSTLGASGAEGGGEFGGSVSATGT